MTDPSYTRRFNAALAETDAAGIWRSNAFPPLLHGLRKLGLKPRPPHYMVFWRSAALMSVFFGTVWGLIMQIILWGPQGQPAQTSFTSAALTGLAFGLAMASYYAWGRRRYGLSKWHAL